MKITNHILLASSFLIYAPVFGDTSLPLRVEANKGSFKLQNTVTIPNFIGTYKVRVNGEIREDIITVSKGKNDEFILDNKEWSAILFWDKLSMKFKGVFRYKDQRVPSDKPLIANKEVFKDGKFENLVGFYTCVPTSDGEFKVINQWGTTLEPNIGYWDMVPVK